MIRAIIFDNEGVMVGTDWDLVAAAFSKIFSLPLLSGEKFKDSLQLYGHSNEGLLHQYSCGKISSESYWSLVLQSRDIIPTAGNRAKASSTLELLANKVSDKSIEAVRKMRLQGYSLFLLSNAIPEIVTGIKTREDYFSLFDKCYFSYEMGYRKPSPEAYAVVTRENWFQPSECFFVDDQWENVDAARKIGLVAERYALGENPGLLEVLRRHILLP